jgi:hypothetical protein
VYFAPSIPVADRGNLHAELEMLAQDARSVIGQFAFGRLAENLDECPVPPRDQWAGTEVYVRSGWHQESSMHFTVDLRFVRPT